MRSARITDIVTKHFASAITLQLALLISGVLSARILGPTDRGYLAILTTLASTTCQIGAVGISLSITYHLASGRVGGSEVLDILKRPIGIQVFLLTLAYAAIAVGYTLIADAPIFDVVVVSISQVPALLAADYGIALTLGARRHGLASALRVIAPALYAAGVVWLFATRLGSLMSVQIALVVAGNIAGGLILYAGVRSAKRVQAVDSPVESTGFMAARKEILRFGRRGYVGYLAPTESFRLDQLLVGFLLSPTALGIYVVGAAFTNFPRIVALNVGLSATAEIANQSDIAVRKKLVRHMLLATASLLTAVSLAIGAFIVVAIPALFGEAFRSAIPVGELLLVASWFLCMKRVSVDLLRGAGELSHGTVAEIINLGVFLLAAVPLGLMFGVSAIAAALILASTCGFVFLLVQMRQCEFI